MRAVPRFCSAAVRSFTSAKRAMLIRPCCRYRIFLRVSVPSLKLAMALSASTPSPNSFSRTRPTRHARRHSAAQRDRNGVRHGRDLLRPSSSICFILQRLISSAASSVAASSAGAFLGFFLAAALAASSASAILAAFSSARFLGGFARLGLLGVVARRTLRMPAASRKRPRGRSAARRPTASACAVFVELHALARILGEQRVVGADLLQILTPSRGLRLSSPRCENAALLGATARKTKCNCHFSVTFRFSLSELN